MVQAMSHSALKGAQAGAMIVPPVFLVASLILRRGGGFSIRKLMTNSVGGVLVGAAGGVLMGYGKMKDESEVAIQEKTFRLASREK